MSKPPELRIGGILLAAGASRRMGTNKLLLEIEGEPVVRRACRTVLLAGLDPVIVVLGHEAERTQLALAGLDIQCAFNADFPGPMSRSLHLGLSALPTKTDAAVILLADMVGVEDTMLRTIATAAATEVAPLIVSRYGDTLAPPVLFRRALFPEVMASHGEGCGKAVIRHHFHEAIFLDWPRDRLVDLDTPQDFAALKTP